MTHDPLQSYAMLGAYPGVPTLQPFTGPQTYAQFGSGINPLAQQQLQQLQQLHQLQQLQHLQQLSSILGQINNPQQGFSPFQQGGQGFGGFGQPTLGGFQNPWAALQNPLIAAALQNPLLNPLLAQTIATQSPYQQGGYGGFGQTGYGLAPQSWIGQGQAGQIYQQLAARALATQGINPWAGY